MTIEKDREEDKEIVIIALQTCSHIGNYQQLKPPTDCFISRKKVHLSSLRFPNFREHNKTCCDKFDAIREYRREE